MTSYKTWSRAAGILALCGGLAVVLGVIGLKHTFGYPEIIRAEPGVIMQRLFQTRDIVPYLYYFGVGGAGVCLLFFAVFFSGLLNKYGEDFWSSLGRICGIISGILLYVGIIRYSILFPKLALLRNSSLYDNNTIDLIFIAMNTYAGEAIAEHAQFIFTSLMLCFFALSARRTRLLPLWMSIFAVVIAIIDIIGNLEHFGYSFAFIFNRTGPKLFALWLLITGIILIFKKHNDTDTI